MSLMPDYQQKMSWYLNGVKARFCHSVVWGWVCRVELTGNISRKPQPQAQEGWLTLLLG